MSTSQLSRPTSNETFSWSKWWNEDCHRSYIKHSWRLNCRVSLTWLASNSIYRERIIDSIRLQPSIVDFFWIWEQSNIGLHLGREPILKIVWWNRYLFNKCIDWDSIADWLRYAKSRWIVRIYCPSEWKFSSSSGFYIQVCDAALDEFSAGISEEFSINHAFNDDAVGVLRLARGILL